jgi:hypothetical protein
MNKLAVSLALLALSLTLAPAVSAGEGEDDGPEWDWFGSLRVRPEYNENLSDATAAFDDKIAYGSYRANLGARVTLDNDVSVVVDVQAMGLWGEDYHPYRGWITEGDTEADFGLFQGYIEAKNIFGTKFSARAGRMPLVYGDEWLLGDLDFYGGTSYDGIRGEFDRENGHSSFFWAKLAETNAPEHAAMGWEDMSGDSDLSGIWHNWYIGEKHLIEAAFIYYLDDIQMPGDYYASYQEKRKTVTMQYAYNDQGEEGPYGRLNTAYQWGTELYYDDYYEEGYDVDLDAYAVEVTGGWNFLVGDLPYKVWIRWAHYTGDDADTEDCETFSPLYQDFHGRYGPLDFWHGFWGFVPYAGGDGGLQIIQLGSEGTLPSGLRLGVQAQQASRTETFSPTQTVDNLGKEYSVQAAYDYGKHLTLELGIAQLYPGTSLSYEPPFFPSTVTKRAYLNTVVRF